MSSTDPGAALHDVERIRKAMEDNDDVQAYVQALCELGYVYVVVPAAAPAPPPAPSVKNATVATREALERLHRSAYCSGAHDANCTPTGCEVMALLAAPASAASAPAQQAVGVPAEGLRCVRRKGHEGAHTPFMAWKTDTFERCGAEVPITAEEIERRGFVAEDMGTAWSRGPNEPFAATPAATGLDVERLRKAMEGREFWMASEYRSLAAAYNEPRTWAEADAQFFDPDIDAAGEGT